MRSLSAYHSKILYLKLLLQSIWKLIGDKGRFFFFRLQRQTVGVLAQMNEIAVANQNFTPADRPAGQLACPSRLKVAGNITCKTRCGSVEVGQRLGENWTFFVLHHYQTDPSKVTEIITLNVPCDGGVTSTGPLLVKGSPSRVELQLLKQSTMLVLFRNVTSMKTS
ncbi:hypothetical protein DAPPUDRAFT_100684 [Daphnia pulex]|uniref:Uncharacterized protein n=1 Tax=Daphnia pulex TaxID=6669 RepID=E9GB40_DAPPU|nr:hypothetical protein DAPPUDRAFT_100684 [Daphnia pulex]|eukprot:EFX83434.1 hypothetical protein DAPPUDRAFT_100684 [Daphnia pulex]